jgi:hypothetical protein
MLVTNYIAFNFYLVLQIFVDLTGYVFERFFQ